MNTKLILVLAALTAATAVPAQAEEVTLRVAYDDAELTTDAGVAAITERLSDAADDVCSPLGEMMVSLNATATCKSTLMRKAVAQLETRRAEVTGE